MRFHIIGDKIYPCIFSYLIFHSYKISSFTYTTVFRITENAKQAEQIFQQVDF